MEKDNHLFGTSGVRGIVGGNLTTGLCRDVAQAIASTLQVHSHICIATDTRLSRETIKDAVVSGFVNSGIDVTDLGILPTPTLAFITKDLGFSTGVMITASHNPPEYNGIKLFNGSGIGYSKRQETEIDYIYHNKSFRSGYRGCLSHSPAARDSYFNFISNAFPDIGETCNLKVVVDAGNGAAAGFASYLLSSLGIDVIPLNDEPDGHFPGRNPEPKEDTLGGTVEFLKQHNADLAVCFDGDADRVAFCDNEGFLGFNEMIAFISRIALKGSGQNKNGEKIIAATYDTGWFVDAAVEDLGGEVVRGEIGDVRVAYLTRKLEAAIGVEPNGVYIFPEAGYYPDTIFTALALLSQLQDVSQIRGYFTKMPKLYYGSRKVDYTNNHEIDFKQLSDYIRLGKRKTLNGKPVYIKNGIRLEIDGSWLLIRVSGTEPVVRVIAESTSKRKTANLLDRGSIAVSNILKNMGGKG